MKEPLWMAPINTIKKNIAYAPLSSNSTRDLMTVSALARHVMNSTQLTLALGKLAAKLTEPDVIVPLIICQGWNVTTNSYVITIKPSEVVTTICQPFFNHLLLLASLC